MQPFKVIRAYRSELDARDHASLFDDISGDPPNGVLWSIVAPRRAGKTWALKALEYLFNEQLAGSARFLDLRLAPLPAPSRGAHLLLDEPGLELDRDAPGFLDRCAALQDAGTRVILAMSPAEWVLLEQADRGGGQVDSKARLFLAPLTPSEAAKLASRSPKAGALLDCLPPNWRRNPFLLELLFQLAAEDIDPHRDLRQLLQIALDATEQNEYLDSVLGNGLTDQHRVVLSRVARGVPPETPDTLMTKCGLVASAHGLEHIADPVLEAHLCPLRIHHISDIHIGPKAAKRVDVKEAGAVGDALGAAAGAGTVRESYADHLNELGAQGRAPHLIAITGDIVEYGSDEQYEVAKAWLVGLVASLAEHPRLGRDDPRLLIVGGNHDVDWSATAGPAGRRQRHLPFARAFEGFPRTARARLDDPPQTRPRTVVCYPDFGVEVVLLGSAEFGGELAQDPVRDQLIELIDKLKKGAMDEMDEEKAEKLRANVARIDPGLVHHQDLKRIGATPLRQPVILALLHHPVSPLPATEIVRFTGLLNAGEVKDTLYRAGCCLVLHGHVHTGWFGKEQWPERHDERVMRIAAAPSLGSSEIQESHGFNEIEISRERKDRKTEYVVTVRRMCREGTGWTMKAEMPAFAPGT